MSGFTCSHGVTNQQFEFIRKSKWIFIGVRNWATGLIANRALSSKGKQALSQMVVRCIGCTAIIISISYSISRGSCSCRLSDAFQNLDIYNCIPIVSTCPTCAARPTKMFTTFARTKGKSCATTSCRRASGKWQGGRGEEGGVGKATKFHLWSHKMDTQKKSEN